MSVVDIPTPLNLIWGSIEGMLTAQLISLKQDMPMELMDDAKFLSELKLQINKNFLNLGFDAEIALLMTQYLVTRAVLELKTGLSEG